MSAVAIGTRAGEAKVNVPWLVRSAPAGTVGTAAMTLTYVLERRLRPNRRGPLDYDDSPVPGQILASTMRVQDATSREVRNLAVLDGTPARPKS
jgi:hypothetical protein